MPREEDPEREGLRSVRLQEQWRIGQDDDDVFFGAVGQVLSDPSGNILVLDRQQSQVVAISPEGEYLRRLVREGDGPGEVRYPRDLLMMPDGTIGVTQMVPGKIVMVSPEGVPKGQITLRQQDSGGLFALFSAKAGGGTLVVAGDKMGDDPAVVSRTRFLSTITPEGREQVRLLADEFAQVAENFVWDEERDYFVHMGGLAVGPDGLVYTAPDRDRFRIEVFEPDGTRTRVIEREYAPRKRTAAEIRTIHDTRRMVRNGQEVPKRIGDYEPVIRHLWVDEANRLWVLHSRSGSGQPEGILQTYEVYDDQGTLVEQVAIEVPGDPDEDRLFLLSRDRAVLVRGYTGGMLALVGARGNSGDSEETGDAPIELIFYRMSL